MISDRINQLIKKNPGAYVTARGVEIKRANGTVELLASIRGLQEPEAAPEKSETVAPVVTPTEPEKKVEAAPKPKPGPKPKAESKAE